MVSEKCAMDEQWRPVPNWPYEASSEGRIRRSIRQWRNAAGTIVTQYTKGQFYPMVTLWRDQAPRRWHVAAHRVVAEAWLGPKPSERHEIDHIDGDRFNPKPSNLEWVIHAENIDRSVRRGHRGENRWNAKLTEDLVRAMWTLKDLGFMQREIASLLGVSKSDVSRVHAGITWKHVRRPACGSVEVEEASLQEALRA